MTTVDRAAAWATGRATALLPRRQDLVDMTRSPRRDLVAGLTVGIVALPLALAFGISSGMGAGAGMVTAVVAGLLAAIFGGSNLQVSGPTGAMTVVLVPIIAEFGGSGVLVVGLMAGLLLVGMAAAGAGRYVKLIPLPVIEGFTLGIAVIIAVQQVPAALGVTGEGENVVVVAWRAAVEWLAAPQWWPLVLAAGVALVMLVGSRVRPALPASLIAVVAATLAAETLDLDVARIGALPAGLPAPGVPVVPWADLGALVVPAVAVALLAALESLLSATVADAMSVSERHDPDRELFGQGVANLASPLFGGIPATAAIARTAVNVRSGASSRLAAVIHALVLLAAMMLLAQVVGTIPLAALAGVLIATALRMVEVSSVRALLRSSRGDAAVLVLTALATVALDLVTAVVLGVLVAGALALRQIAQAATLQEVPLEPVPGTRSEDAEEHALLDEHIVAYRLDGPLFFVGAHQSLLELSELSDIRVVILRMSRVATLDATGAAVLRDTIRQLEGRGISVMLSGVKEQHSPVLDALGVYESLAHEQHLFATTPEAIAHARLHAARTPHDPTGPEKPSDPLEAA
ncbi:MAG: SulP family inorganic anion transporter [Brachybacterium paraconglomeratum]|nr:SulP family inorganic anion transporter [Brachybacterium paraconglomeratum]